MYDILILGAGPAGMAAAIYASRAGLSVAVLEQNPMAGGQIVDTYEVDNYPGLPGLSGFDLAAKLEEHMKKYEPKVLYGSITGVEARDGAAFAVKTDDGVVHEAKTLVLATGAEHAKLGIPGENELGGKGVSYCATCDGAFFRGKTALVVGGGDVAVEDAIFLTRFCRHVYLVHRRDELRAAKVLQKELFALENAEVIWDSVVRSVEGNGKVERVVVENVKSGMQQTIDTDACFIAVGILPRTKVFEGFVDLDEKGYVIAGETGETSRPGVFAAGDLRTKRLRQVVTAVADGANAATAAADYLVLSGSKM